MRNLTQPLLFALFLLILLAGCAGVRPPEEPGAAMPTVDTAAIRQMADEGRFLDAALTYARLAGQSVSPQREGYSLAAAEFLMQGNYVPQAVQTLSEIDATQLDAAQLTRKALLGAEIALARQRAEQALAALDGIEPGMREQAADTRTRFHSLRAQSFAALGNHLEMARERVFLEPLLDNPGDILANQQTIMAGLQTLSPEALNQLRTAPPPDVLGGWLELARMGQTAGEAGDVELARWRERYPQHPALDPVIAALLEGRPQALTMPARIALILPLNNRFAKAAAAVRDGFLAAYYAQMAAPGTDRNGAPVPSLRLYDEGDAPAADIQRIYQQAVADGAEFVVGPLDKDAVNALARSESLPVPVLALNYVDDALAPSDSLFQISLSPEQEARQVAERAWLDGHTRVAAISPDSEWGQRVAKAFNERWLQLGGHVVEAQHYDTKLNDYSLPIRRLLNVDESEERSKAVRAMLSPAPDQKLEFTPRRRQDIDFIFMAAFSRQARLIRPQLRFHYAAKVPVYATSHAFDGTVDKEMDRDMDGVQFPDMPWTLGKARTASGLKAEITALWPGDAKHYPRLYALGVDAYHVIGHLNGLRRNRAEFFPGETGDLSLDMANRLQRRLVWSRFENGVPRLLKEFQ
jgi:hypothetical protein